MNHQKIMQKQLTSLVHSVEEFNQISGKAPDSFIFWLLLQNYRDGKARISMQQLL